ncbi:hypothetical protein C8R45DRAFT_1128887 [Mycena sanguinolenta]|nr:hypothetical protein C8R45DRAFT_1128887 [Mycena sanguinolenta]
MSSTAVRSSRFYDEGDGTGDYPVFQVNDTLYRLDPNALSRNSDYLEGLLRAPGPDNKKQMSSEEHPIVLINAENAEFEIFVALAYGRPPKENGWDRGSSSIPSLLRLLELARYFISPATKRVALSHLKTRAFHVHPAQLIHISFTHGAKLLFETAFRRLVLLDLRELTDQHVVWLGFKVYVALARLKEAIQQQRCILAAEGPQFRKTPRGEGPAHGATCTDNNSCGEDWHCVGWNGIGRFMLDGRNPQTWADSVQQFEDFEFGRMNPQCVKTMLDKVRGGGGYGHVFDMIDGVAAQLMRDIVEQDEED